MSLAHHGGWVGHVVEHVAGGHDGECPIVERKPRGVGPNSLD